MLPSPEAGDGRNLVLSAEQAPCRVTTTTAAAAAAVPLWWHYGGKLRRRLFIIIIITVMMAGVLRMPLELRNVLFK